MDRPGRAVWEVSLTAHQIALCKKAAEIAFERSSGKDRRDFGRLAERLSRSLEDVGSAAFLHSSNGSRS